MPDEFNWAVAIIRQLLCVHFHALRLQRMARSAWKPMADLSARLAAEEQVHLEHADSWVRRLGTGTEDARQRLQSALDDLAPLAPGLYEPFEGLDAVEAAGIYPPLDTPIDTAWLVAVRAVTDDARLSLNAASDSAQAGGRRGHHSEHLAPLLREMGEVFRLEPDAAW